MAIDLITVHVRPKGGMFICPTRAQCCTSHGSSQLIRPIPVFWYSVAPDLVAKLLLPRDLTGRDLWTPTDNRFCLSSNLSVSYLIYSKMAEVTHMITSIFGTFRPSFASKFSPFIAINWKDLMFSGSLSKWNDNWGLYCKAFTSPFEIKGPESNSKQARSSQDLRLLASDRLISCCDQIL